MARRVLTLVERIKKNIALPEMKILPGQLAFFFILTIIPLVASIFSIASNLHISKSFINSLIETQFPDTIVSFVKFLSANEGAELNKLVFFISALILASNGTNSMITASNQIYKIKNKGYIYDRIKALFMLVILILLILFIIAVPVCGDYLMKGFSALLNMDIFDTYIYSIYKVLNLPISWFFIFFSIKLLYTLAPDQKLPSRKVNYGALFTSFSWVIFTKLFSIYVSTFGRYTTIYGGISSLLVLMLWIYILAYLFVLGMVLNVSKYEEKKE